MIDLHKEFQKFGKIYSYEINQEFIYDPQTNKTTALNLQKANVRYFKLEDTIRAKNYFANSSQIKLDFSIPKFNSKIMPFSI